MRNKKVILDTNLWISFLISKRYSKLDDLLDSGKIIFIFSQESVEEFLTVVRRPKFKNYFSDSDLNELIRLFNKYGKLVKVKSQLSLCRDTKDNFLLNLAVDSKAEYLITGDSDLLILKKVSRTQILTWKEFLETLSLSD
jgi:putative PIN family toxin of toxin-antitoxin system